MILGKIRKRIVLQLGKELHRLNKSIAHVTLPNFGNEPQNVKIDLPRRIINPERIFLGNNVSFGPGSFINAMTHYPTRGMQHPNKDQLLQRFDSKIIIGSNVTSTADLQIAAQSEIIIEDDVMFASNIHINDAFHGFETANEPYKYQKIFRIDPIRIGWGCWIGQNVVILSGVTIGQLSIIGANSVVTRSVPARCIALGTPAKVVRKWDEHTHKWISVAGSHGRDTT